VINYYRQEQEHFDSLRHARGWVDVHVYFTPRQLQEMSQAYTGLREKFGRSIKMYQPVHRPIGPHPLPMFEAHVHPKLASQVMQWLHQNTTLSALVHPHTKEGGMTDHTKNARFVRGPLKLNLGIFA
jgi:DOPA 4,5-dioxygenase